MIVVSDSSPLITFARTSLFYLLGQLFNEITIPEEVNTEVAVRGAGLPGAMQTQQASWVRITSIQNTTLLARWRAAYRLGAGEVATIILAKELPADVALLDERKARLLARAEGVRRSRLSRRAEICYRRGDIADMRQTYAAYLAGVRIERRFLTGVSPRRSRRVTLVAVTHAFLTTSVDTFLRYLRG